eukprot:271453-Prorocentrum_minimum.AAC.3
MTKLTHTINGDNRLEGAGLTSSRRAREATTRDVILARAAVASHAVRLIVSSACRCAPDPIVPRKK